jgi:hypothetical protein
MNRFLILLILVCSNYLSFAQNTQFDQLASKILLNAWHDTTNDQLSKFIKQYVPIISPVRGILEKGPPVYDVPDLQATAHSFIFQEHPYFHEKFHTGELQFLTKETEGKVVSIQNIEMILKFDSKTDANKTFDKLCEMFAALSSKKRIINNGELRRAQFDNPDENEFPPRVEFEVVEDLWDGVNYKLLYRFVPIDR